MAWWDDIVDLGRKTGMEVQLREPMTKHTYFQIGGPADAMIYPKTLEDLKVLADFLEGSQVPYVVVGAGSNLLVSDSGFRGVVVRAKKLNLTLGIDEATGYLRAGAGVPVSMLLSRAAREGWTGLEFLTGIPGSMGGVVAMNGGTHLGDAAGCLQSVRVVSLKTGALREFKNDELVYAYRRNLFLQDADMVWDALWKVGHGDPAQVKKTLDEMLFRRKSTQPLDHPSCGSTFKNPKAHGLLAWQVIERLGLRGYRHGNAQFSEKHCNFILNLGGASAEDVRALIHLAKSRAKSELGIPLEEEVKYLGEFSASDHSL